VNYELIVGLEIHAQLLTETKAFCRCPNRYGASPNTLTCPTCLGLPGALPVLNGDVVMQATKLALALDATIHPRCKFDRKNYFYPDLPKGYQISQFDEPFSTDGHVDIAAKGASKRIRITRAHIEEDAGKSMHQDDGFTIVDMNRCGVPLVEIVTEPDFRAPEEAAAFVTAMRELLRYVNVCDGNMEQGSLRCDVNISVRPVGQSALNERTEIKNLNSIRSVERAVWAERDRQIKIYESGGTVKRETLLWDEAGEEIRAMRRKEGSDDYRYFPEPDLVELSIAPDFVERIKAAMPKLPAVLREEYRATSGLSEYQAGFVTASVAQVQYFEDMLRLNANPAASANWMQEPLQGIANANNLTWQELRDTRFPPVFSAALLETIAQGHVSHSMAKQTAIQAATQGLDPRDLLKSEDVKQVSDEDQLRAVVQAVLEKYPDEVARYKAGKQKLFSFFMNEAMTATQRRANPKLLSALLQDMLSA
jgi:aspartyl-tRNA(Asn)/glutamyl-tRNA(Gln) amidotransferase subunit B